MADQLMLFIASTSIGLITGELIGLQINAKMLQLVEILSSSIP